LHWSRTPRPADLRTRSGPSACKSDRSAGLKIRERQFVQDRTVTRRRRRGADSRGPRETTAAYDGSLQPPGGTVAKSQSHATLGSIIRGADAAPPSRASADGAAGLAYGRACDTYAVDSGPAHATPDGNLRYHAVRQSKRRRRHALRRRCYRQDEPRNSNKSEHSSLLPVDPMCHSAYVPPGSVLR
jgi:hypothetical protein